MLGDSQCRVWGREGKLNNLRGQAGLIATPKRMERFALSPCDQRMRGWSHHALMVPPVNILSYSIVKSVGPTTISEHSPHQFHGWNRTEVCCDRGVRGWSHHTLMAPPVDILGYKTMKNGGPTPICEHNPQQFHGWNETENLLWWGHEIPIAPSNSGTICRHL